mgnify:CR=1 FL=1
MNKMDLILIAGIICDQFGVLHLKLYQTWCCCGIRECTYWTLIRQFEYLAKIKLSSMFIYILDAIHKDYL